MSGGVNGRDLPPLYPPTSQPSLRRLRDHFGDRDDVANRAGEIIRAVMPPAPLDPRAGARVLSAVRHSPGRGAWWLQRLVLATATLVVVGAIGAGAAAALDLIELTWPPGRPQVTPLPPPPARPPAHRPAARAAPAPPPAAAIETAAPRGHRRPLAEPNEALQLEEARLIIDPRSPAHRPQLPDEFAEKHAGQVFSWQVKICVSPSGAVASARLAAPVHPQLDRRLLRAINAWKYRPARLDGRPVRSCTDVVYRLTVEPAGTQ